MWNVDRPIGTPRIANFGTWRRAKNLSHRVDEEAIMVSAAIYSLFPAARETIKTLGYYS